MIHIRVGAALWWRYSWRVWIVGTPVLAGFAMLLHADLAPMWKIMGVMTLAGCYFTLCAWVLSRWFLPASQTAGGVCLMPTRKMPLPYAAGWALLWAVIWRPVVLSVIAHLALSLLARTGAFSTVSIGFLSLVATLASQIGAFVWLSYRQYGAIQLSATP